MAPKPRNGNSFTLDGDGGTPSGDGKQPVTDADGINGSPGAVDPATLAGGGSASDTAGEPVKRGRGRPKGSGAPKTGQKAQLDIGSVETLLFNIHSLLAGVTQIEQLAINETEAKSLATAVANVQQFYPMHVSAKAFAWTNLIMVGGSVYGSRAVAIWAEKKAAENRHNMPPQSPPVNVSSLRPVN